jgi:hypothetical protein
VIDPLWIIPSILRVGSITLTGGAPLAGKTTLILQWLAAWKAGLPFLGYPPGAYLPWVYLALDKQLDDMANDLNKVGLNPDECDFHSLHDDADPSWQEWFLTGNEKKRIPLVIKPEHRLVVIDCGTFFASSINDKKSVRRFLSPFCRWLRDTGRSSWLTGHERKYLRAGETDPGDRFEGSNYWRGGATICTMSVWSDEPVTAPNHRMVAVSPRRGEKRVLKAAFDETGLLAFELLPDSFSKDVQRFFFKSPEKFPTGQALVLGQWLGYKERTVKGWLQELSTSGWLVQPKYGHWEKANPESPFG